MSLKVGSNNIGELFVGSDRIVGAYVGSDLVYSYSPAPSFDGYVVKVMWADGSSLPISAQGFKLNGTTVASSSVAKGYLYTYGGGLQTFTTTEIESACSEHDKFITWGRGCEFWFQNTQPLSSAQWHCYEYFQTEGVWNVTISRYTGNVVESTPIYSQRHSVSENAWLTFTI